MWGGNTGGSSAGAGTYALKGTTGTDNCPAGFACPYGSVAPQLCSIGTYASGNSGSCSSCSHGSHRCYYSGHSTCTSGWYHYTGSDRYTECHRCPLGYTCDGNTATQLTSAGTYATGAAGSASGCTAGYYCPSPTHNTQNSCPAGTYSSSNSGSCSRIPDGHYRSGGSYYQCASGQYTYGTTGCQNCPAGFFCTNPTATPTPCPSGQYNTGASAAASCSPCPNGNYCSQTAISGTCSNGYYSENGQSVCSKCPAGMYCQNGV
jgi:hypothetical protein